MNLIADIGGTNARLALAGSADPEPLSLRRYRNADFASFEDVLERYLADTGEPRFKRMVIAVAGPILGNAAQMTNLSWRIAGPELVARFGAENVVLINDLTALGHAARHLGPDQLDNLVEGNAAPDLAQQALVVGIGTGFNVSPIIHCGDKVICPSVEAGHASLPMSVAREMARYAAGLDAFFPTIEHCFSGRGLQDFLHHMTGLQDTDAADHVARYGVQGYEKATAAVDLYATMLGHLLNDLTLAYLPARGIFLAGGVARSVLSTPAARHCAEIMRRPSQYYPGQVPAWIITGDVAALIGCASVASRGDVPGD